MPKNLSEKLRRELRDLSLVRDDEIDTSDIPETVDWSNALPGLWASKTYEPLSYDIRGVANEILKRAWKVGARPSNMWLNKVAWFVYERALVEFGKLITPARVEAWDHGPVFREIYGPAKVYKDEPVTQLLTSFSIEAKSMVEATIPENGEISLIIDEAITKFGNKTASQLRAISHIEASPWFKVWYSPQKISAGMVISPNLILASYKAAEPK